MQRNEFTVTQLNEYVGGLLKGDPVLSSITVKGEISGYVLRNKHRYFTLKDQGAAVDCALFAYSSKNLRFEPKNGDQVLATGAVGLYVVGGKYQLYVKTLEPQGRGDLYLQFEQLKKQLQDQGLFDAAHKKPLPLLPRRIGIVTSPQGAAIQDMVRTITNKFDNADILLYPAVVQGKQAHHSIAAGIQHLDGIPEVEVIIVGRGGGAMEDLWCFNEELVARTIFAAQTPIISAVGHESDFTIADFVADARAATPTAAAEMCIVNKAEWLTWIGEQTLRLSQGVRQGLQGQRQRLELKRAELGQLSPVNQIHQRRQRLDNVQVQLDNAVTQLLQRRKGQLERCAGQLDSLNPSAVLSRGYAIVKSQKGVVSKVAAVQSGEQITIVVSDGAFGARVEAEPPPPAEKLIAEKQQKNSKKQ